MFNLGHLTTAVQKNCHISDAQYAGDYTLCVFLLKMREFFRWEHQIPLHGPLPREDVGRWMQEREQMWESLDASAFESLPLGEASFDPFDAAAINREVLPLGYVYSAGYGRFNKPHFFLGALERREQREDATVLVSSCEYARDLVAPPAMMLNGVIYLRQESLRRFLWERFEEWRWNRQNDAMTKAVAGYGFENDVEEALERMTAVETESAILHEVGEARAERILGSAWPEMLAGLARTKTEIQLRAVRDILADCLSTLPGLLERDQPGAVHFYFANFSGMRRHLYPDAMDAYRLWARGDRQALARLVQSGRARWLETAQAVLDLYHQHGAESGPMIEQLLDHPPTCQILATR